MTENLQYIFPHIYACNRQQKVQIDICIYIFFPIDLQCLTLMWIMKITISCVTFADWFCWNLIKSLVISACEMLPIDMRQSFACHCTFTSSPIEVLQSDDSTLLSLWTSPTFLNQSSQHSWCQRDLSLGLRAKPFSLLPFSFVLILSRGLQRQQSEEDGENFPLHTPNSFVGGSQETCLKYLLKFNADSWKQKQIDILKASGTSWNDNFHPHLSKVTWLCWQTGRVDNNWSEVMFV